MDTLINDLITREKERQRETLGLIASENIVSTQVLKAQGSILTNKYAEGYPGRRYYAGNQIIDEIETLAITRACELFGVKYANVQPHSGSNANMEAYFALLDYGDKIMGLNLSHGGHLTHGSPVNFSGKWYDIVAYDVDVKTGLLDYDKIEQLAKTEKPKLIQCGYTAYSRSIDFKRFKEIADSVDAYLIADIAHIAGLVAGKSHSSPVGHADVITSTTHKTLRGPRGGLIMTDDEDISIKVRKAVFPGLQGGPLEHVIAGKAVCFSEANTPEFKEYAQQIVTNAKTLSTELIDLGYNIVSKGTDNHLMMLDFGNNGMTGKLAQSILEDNGIITNKNTVPGDTRSPFVTSGVRIGTPLLTTRGMKQDEMVSVAQFIDRALRGENVKSEVKSFSIKYPIDF